MKLSEYTKKILKNIAEINGGLVITPVKTDSNGNPIDGTLIKTINKAKSMQMIAVVPEKFEHSVLINDLNKFLGALSTLTDPEAHFEDKRVLLRDATGAVSMRYTQPGLIIHTEQTMDLPKDAATTTVELSEDQLSKVLKAAGVLNLQNVRFFKNDDGKLVLQATNAGVDSSDSYAIELGDAPADFEEVVFVTEMLNLIPGDYRVELTSRVAKFSHASHKGLSYAIGTKRSN